MKLKLHLLLLALCAFVFLPSCESEDDIALSAVPADTRSAFESRFPNVNNAHWEAKRNYYVAEFYENGHEVEAWFTTDGVWAMTETDFGRNISLLPAAVQEAFAASQYAVWVIDNINFYERTNGTFYLIDVETKGQRDHNLFFTLDGNLIKAVPDKENDDILPNTVL